MSQPASEAPDWRVLVLARVGRDAQVICESLAQRGLACRACHDFAELLREIGVGAGAIVVAEEALGRRSLKALASALGAQPPWSDLPFVLLTGSGEAALALERTVSALRPAGNVTIVERPSRVVTLTTAVETALRARRRQYEARDVLAKLQETVERLDAERIVRERFVSLLAHDLRGPLSVAKLSAQALARRPERLDERRDLALKIDRNLERADRMIRDLLDANRLRAGERLAIDVRGGDLVEIAREVVDDLEVEGRRVVIEAPERLEGFWDSEALRRALCNLVTNALKYGSPDTEVRVRLAEDGEQVVLAVHNWGKPLSPGDRAHLFEPFRRLSTADPQRKRGWGLGLVLVRGSAEAHSGSVEVESSPENGTTFTIRLPRDSRPYVPRRGAPVVEAPAEEEPRLQG